MEARIPDDQRIKMLDVCSDEVGEVNNKISIPWLIGSLIISIVLAKWSKGSACSYIFWSFAWLYVSILITQSQRKFQRGPKLICGAAVAALAGWLIGTCLIWKVRDHRVLFFD